MNEVIKIRGAKTLSGTIHISGSKNLCVSLIPAAILARGLVIIHNIPPISDVYHLVSILEELNVFVKYHEDTLFIDSSQIKFKDLTMPEMGKLRASYYFYSVFLGMFNNFKANTIGGCRLGDRPIDLHLSAFEKMGAKIEEQEGIYKFEVVKLKPAHIVFEKISVGATINALLLAVQIKGKTVLENVAREPEIIELINFLELMGAKIEGKGTGILTIFGGRELHGCEFTNIPDRIEVGTYCLIGATVGKKLKIKPVITSHIQTLLDIFDVLHIPYFINENELTISKGEVSSGVVILTAPYPGFPTDLQQPLTTFLAVSKFTSVIIESIYDNRFAHVVELNKMGADISVNNMNIVIHGVRRLKGVEVSGKDLRGAVSLVLAGLMAEGETTVKGLEFLNRGYENMIAKLKKVHADIELVVAKSED